MVRTVATAVRASGGKSSKAAKTSTTPKAANTSSSNDRHTIGGNTVCPRETPTWQKPITNFFTKQMEHPRELNIFENMSEETDMNKKTADADLLEQGSSTMNNVRNNCDEFSNKENTQSDKLQNKPEKKNKAPIKSEDNIDKNKISPKKQKLDFYKHLEEIEQI